MREIFLTHTIDCGHRIVGHKGKCARLHGHTYKFDLTLGGDVVPPGFVVDFGDVKDLINEWDHKMLLWNVDELVPMIPAEHLVVTRFNPTAENMAEYIAEELLQAFALERADVVLWETPKCCAKYTAHA